MQTQTQTQMQTTMVASLYIPIIGKDITHDYIAKCFHDNNIGKVCHVDFVLNKQKLRREAFVHFSEWYTSEPANQLKAQLEIANASGQNCRFMHNGTNYWPLLLNKNPLEKDSPLKKSNSVYEIEDRILNIEDRILNIQRKLERLSFMSKLHDANIRYILQKSNDDGVNHENGMQTKRMKTETGGYIYTDDPATNRELVSV